MHLAGRQLPQVALAFEQFLRERGQALVLAHARTLVGAALRHVSA